jgi:tripartite-type tricarboxylate transporter receptor subunit TctC
MEMHKSASRFALAGALISLAGMLALPVQAQVNFSGERIVWIVPSQEGGGSDTLTRSLQKFYTKHLPGNPQIVVRNVPGSGQVQGTNHFFDNAKPDGLMVITSSTSSIMNQALGNKAVRYDLAKSETVIAIPQGTFV